METEDNIIFSLAPMQGYTDYVYRNAINKYIGGIDKYYTPYLRLQNDGTLKNKDIKDVLPENNKLIKVIPQILTNNAADTIYLCNYLNELGYNEVNINLGCPYPMVAKRNLGSGLLEHPEQVRKMLEETFKKVSVDISVKLRLGYNTHKEILDIIPILNELPVSEIILHPRIGKDLYKNEARYEHFKAVQDISAKKLSYNGDIENLSRYINLRSMLGNVSHFMIGRGILKNPFLVHDLKNNISENESIKREKLQSFHSDIFDNYSTQLSGDSHLVNKISLIWEYLSYMFNNQNKIYKRIKKIKKASEMSHICNEIIANEELYAG